MDKAKNKKRVAITIYLDADFADMLFKRYASTVLDGYSGSKQVFLNECILTGLKILEDKRSGRDL